MRIPNASNRRLNYAKLNLLKDTEFIGILLQGLSTNNGIEYILNNDNTGLIKGPP